jgi:hypothetical protein
MKKLLLVSFILALFLNHPTAYAAPNEKQLAEAYKYAYLLYLNKKFDQAKDIFKKVALVSRNQETDSQALYFYSLSAFRTQDFEGCVKGLTILAKKWPQSKAIRGGYVSRFADFVINQVAILQTHWDFFRYKGVNEDGVSVWKESVPPGFKVKRINFRLGFGLYNVLTIINPNSSDVAVAKQKLEGMLNTPIAMIWVDEKPAATAYGHPADFFAKFSIKEKKIFSRFMCERMFYKWNCDKFYQFFQTYDDVRNLKPRFTARTKQPIDESQTAATSKGIIPIQPGAPSSVAPPPAPPLTGDVDENSQAMEQLTSVLTLSRLFQVAGYDPYKDSFTSLVDSANSDLSL